MTDRSHAEILCLSCGMCCSGTLHNWTKLRSQEKTEAGQLGLDVFTRRDGTAAFHQPCTAFEEPVCAIYAHRPQACREYVCPLLKQMVGGEISLEQALGHTRQARQLIANLQSKLTGDMAGLPLEWQVRLSWPPELPLPLEVQSVFEQLVRLLRDVWQVKWRRKNKKRL